MNMLGLLLIVQFAHTACYQKFFFCTTHKSSVSRDFTESSSTCPAYKMSAQTAQKYYFSVAVKLLPWNCCIHVCWKSCYLGTAVVWSLICSRCIASGLHDTITKFWSNLIPMYQIAWPCIAQNSNIYCHHHENLRSHYC
jgi:hypothetical protein